MNHPAAGLLGHYKSKGVPFKLQTPRWTKGQKEAAVQRGPHQSRKEYAAFLQGKYTNMIKKGHWVLLPARLVLDHPDLRLSPLREVPQQYQHPQTISNSLYFRVNANTLQLGAMVAMQFGWALQ